MQRHNDCERLAQQIQTCLIGEIHPEPDVRHFIDSTFAHPSRRELESILKDPDNCEQDTLLELIFFPGQDIQVLLENLIEEIRFQQHDEEVILGMVMEKKPVATLCYPRGNPPIRFTIPEHAARQFISRLNIHKQINSSLLQAICQSLPLDHQVPAKVMIRNARFVCQDSKTAFLEAFVRNMPFIPDNFWEHLEFVLQFLETRQDDTPLKEALAYRKRQYQKNILKAEQFERQRGNRNVETMILQGVRIPHFDSQGDMQKIALIDTVSLALYGKIL